MLCWNIKINTRHVFLSNNRFKYKATAVAVRHSLAECLICWVAECCIPESYTARKCWTTNIFEDYVKFSNTGTFIFKSRFIEWILNVFLFLGMQAKSSTHTVTWRSALLAYGTTSMVGLGFRIGQSSLRTTRYQWHSRGGGGTECPSGINLDIGDYRA